MLVSMLDVCVCVYFLLFFFLRSLDLRNEVEKKTLFKIYSARVYRHRRTPTREKKT